MNGSRPVKLFRNGRNQAVRIPREFELPGEDAVMRQEDGRLIIEPATPKKTLAEVLAYLATLEPLAEDERMPVIERPLPRPFEL